MSRVMIVAGILIWAGATLLLAEWRRLSRPSLAERLRPFSPQGGAAPGGGLLSVESLREVIGPLTEQVGTKLASLFGVSEELELRLRRIHSSTDVSSFRLRQLAWTAAGLMGGLVVASLGPPLPIAVLAVLGLPLLAFLSIEQQLAKASERWQLQLTRELPVVGEQLAMLLNAGYSLGAALARLAARGHGCAATDLVIVINRIRHGLSETEALREWASVARVDPLDRLVSVLALNTEASDLGRLVSAESRQARRDLQRRTTEIIERRAQQVWVPVTVATLIPGVILLAIPFLAALRLFSNA